MRWPFRRKGDRPELSAPAAPAAPAAEDRAPQTPGAPARRPVRQWATLPPLPVTVARTAPLVMGPAPVLPPMLGRRTASAPPVDAGAGRVEGLAKAVPVAHEPPPLVDRPVVPERQETVVRRAVHARPVAQQAPLTEAAPQYVGEPRVPAEPHRAPGWLRYAPTWLTQGDGPDPFGLPVSPPEPPRPAPVERPQPILPPSRLAEVAPETTEESTSDSLTHARPARRPNLGQTRRLGLGAPIKHAEQELVLPQEPEAPAPQPAPAPVSPTVSAPAPVAETPPAAQAEEEADEEPPLPQPPPQPPPLAHKPRPRPAQPAEPRGAEPAVPPEPAPVVRPVPAKADLVYRSAPAPMDRPARRAGTVPVPGRLADAIRGRHGVDVSDVLVHRTPAAATEARTLGARAFTRDAEVYLPEDAGPLDSPKASGLLAHELVHVVQQRTLGPSLPSVTTAAGAELEAEAVRAEHEHGGGHTAAELVHPSITQVLGQAARTAGVQLAPLMSAEVSSVVAPEVTSAVPPVPPSAPELTTLSEPVRQDIGSISEASATRVLEEWTNPELGGSGFGGTGFGGGQLPAVPSSTVESEVPVRLPVVPEPVAVPVETPGALPVPPPDPAEAAVASQVLQVVNLDRATRGEPALPVLDAAALEQIRGMVAEQIAASDTSRALMLATAATSATQAEPGTTRSAGAAWSDDRDGESARDLLAAEEAPVRGPELVRADADDDPFPEDTSALRDGLIDLDKVDLDDLSTRLYDRLRSRLRMELLIDRERAGMLSDFR